MLLHSGGSTFTASMGLNTAPPTPRDFSIYNLTELQWLVQTRHCTNKRFPRRAFGVQTKTDFVCKGSNKAREHLGHQHKGVTATNTERREMNKLSWLLRVNHKVFFLTSETEMRTWKKQNSNFCILWLSKRIIPLATERHCKGNMTTPVTCFKGLQAHRHRW